MSRTCAASRVLRGCVCASTWQGVGSLLRETSYDISSMTKRAREAKRAQKAREKARRREEKRDRAPAAPEIVTQEDIVGRMRPTEEVLADIRAAPGVARSAAPIPSKLFVGSLSDETTSASLRAHFEAEFDIVEAAGLDVGQVAQIADMTIAVQLVEKRLELIEEL